MPLRLFIRCLCVCEVKSKNPLYSEEPMGSWSKVILVLALALNPVQIQCLVSCTAHQATLPSPPPCHRHHSGSAPCSPEIAAAAAVSAPVHGGASSDPATMAQAA